MAFRSIYHRARAIFGRGPSYVIFFVTAKCNSRCRMCFYWKNIDNYTKNELTLEEIKKISINFGPIEYFSVSGGEPFLREDLPDIIEAFATNNHVRFVAIPTNALLTDKIKIKFEEILKRCPHVSFRITLALDGLGERHDHIRGVAGNFKKFHETYKALDELRKRYNNFNLDVNTVLSKYNQDNIEEIFNYVNENLNVDNHVLALARGNTREKIAKDVSIEKYLNAAKLVENIAQSKKNRRKGLYLRLLKTIKLVMRDIIFKTAKEKKAIINCKAGRRLVVISETGDVYPCEILSSKLGNLRESGYDIKKILKSKDAKKVRQFIRSTRCYCTFECAVQNSLIYNLRAYPMIIKKFFRTK